MSGENFRAGYVAIVGAPNAGKSTLLNALVGTKLSIVSPKPQTTRHRILGILSGPGHQIVFCDTPGILHPQYALHEAMMKAAREALADADLVLYLLDAAAATPGASLAGDPAFEAVKGARRPSWLLLTKIDLVARQKLADLAAAASAALPFREVFPVSSLTKSGIDGLLAALPAELPVHPPFYPPDILSEHPERFFVAEIIREKIFERCREELPYSASVDIAGFREEEGKKDLIRAEIFVERQSQKGIVIGKEGRMLRAIGEAARADIEAFLGRPVYLELHVKVREHWRDRAEWLRRLGYA